MQREDTRARMIAALKPVQAWRGGFGRIDCPCPCCCRETLHIKIDRARSEENPNYLFDTYKSCECDSAAIAEKLAVIDRGWAAYA